LAIREQDKSRITSAEMTFMRSRVKYTRQDYNTSEDILLEFKINTVVKKIQNYRNKCVQHVRRMDRDRLPHLIITPCGNEAKDDPAKDFQRVNETGMGHEV
jgi:hypothetical protein